MIIILTKKLFYHSRLTICESFNFLILDYFTRVYIKSHKITIMKLNTKSRYAVMALADMAKIITEEPISLRDISLRNNI